MSCDLTKRIEFLEKQIALIIKNKADKNKALFKEEKPLTEYEVFCQDKKQRAQARREVIDEADDEHEDELPTEDQIQNKLAKMWQSKQEDKEFFETHYRAFKKEVK